MIEYWLMGISIIWVVASWWLIKPGSDTGQAMPISGMAYLLANVPSFLMFAIGLGMLLYSVSVWLLVVELVLIAIFVVPRVPALVMGGMMACVYLSIFAREYLERWKKK